MGRIPWALDSDGGEESQMEKDETLGAAAAAIWNRMVMEPRRIG